MMIITMRLMILMMMTMMTTFLSCVSIIYLFVAFSFIMHWKVSMYSENFHPFKLNDAEMVIVADESLLCLQLNSLTDHP